MTTAAVLIAVLLVYLVIGRDGFTHFLARSQPVPPLRSLAVLPLENFSRDPEQEYFADGMTDALITELAKLQELQVISRTSIMAYKDRVERKTLPEIAQELGVSAVVEGSVLRNGDRIRVDVRLIHGPSDRYLWAASYERSADEILDLQVEIARSIAGEVGVTLPVPRTVSRREPNRLNPQAYDEYLRGRHFWNKRTSEGLQKALQHFRRSIDLEPSFAPAWAGLADTYALLGAPAYGYRPPDEMYRMAKAAAKRALQIDSTLAEAHATLGFAAGTYDWDWAAAEQEFRTAIELNPGYASAHHWYSILLASLGRADEAIREAERATDLDPLSMSINGNVARAHYFARRHDNAIAGYRSALAVGSSSSWPHVGVAMVHAAQDKYSQALEELALATNSFGGLTEGVRGFIHARMGRRNEARQTLDQLVRRSATEYISPVYIAVVLGALGENDQAFKWLDRAYEDRAGMLRFLKVDPLFDPLRADPRFAMLLRQMKLE